MSKEIHICKYKVGALVKLSDTSTYGIITDFSYNESVDEFDYIVAPISLDSVQWAESSIVCTTTESVKEDIRKDAEEELKSDRKIEGKWFKIWFQDRKNVLETMKKNLSADLDAGYDPLGSSIVAQKQHIELFITEFRKDMDEIKNKTKAQVEHWCYYDLMKRGVIE